VTDLHAKLDALTPQQRELVAAFTEGLAPLLGAAELAALADACERDDPRLAQSVTVFPPFSCAANRLLPVERCCASAFALGVARGKSAVGDVNIAFCDAMLPASASSPRWLFVARWDALPRAEALAATTLACRIELEKGTVAS
jgi:hypothetical protein